MPSPLNKDGKKEKFRHCFLPTECNYKSLAVPTYSKLIFKIKFSRRCNRNHTSSRPEQKYFHQCDSTYLSIDAMGNTVAQRSIIARRARMKRKLQNKIRIQENAKAKAKKRYVIKTSKSMPVNNKNR